MVKGVGVNILLFGPPGAGKGTQSALMVKHLSLRHISTGALFRQHMQEGSELGGLAQSYIDKGQLVPDDVTIAILESEILKLEGQGFVLDGFPRTLPQAEALKKILHQQGLKIDKALFLDVPIGLLEERLSGRQICQGCGRNYHIASRPSQIQGVCDDCEAPLVSRADDSPEAIRTRFEVYERTMLPLKKFYTHELVPIDGRGQVEAIWARIKQALNS